MQIKNTRTSTQEDIEIAQILRYNPLRFVREAYVRFIQGLFYAAPPGYYHWEPAPEETEILITDENVIHADSAGKRPAISCTRGPIAFHTLGLDDMLQYDMRTGSKQRTLLIPGTMSVNCCSRVPLEAEQLAWLVGENLWMLRDVMRPWGFYDIGRNVAVGSPSPPGAIVQNDSGEEWYVVTVTSPYQMSRISKATPLGDRIVRSVETHLRGELSGRTPKGNVDGFAIDAFTPGSGENEQPAIGGRIDVTPGEGSLAAHSVRTVAHPLNPTTQVTVRAARSGDPIVRSPMLRGRAIPIRSSSVEESPMDRTIQTRIVRT